MEFCYCGFSEIIITVLFFLGNMLLWKVKNRLENKKAASIICVCIHELRVNDVKNEMMDDDSSFLATGFGWWWLLLWVGLILDQEVGSRVDWAVQEGDLVRKHCLTYIRGRTSLSVHREARGFFRKEDSCKQVIQEHISLHIWDAIQIHLFQNWEIKFSVCGKSLSSNDQSHVCLSLYDKCICQKCLFPVYMEAFPVQKLVPAGVSCFDHLMSQITRRHAGIYLPNLEWFGHYAVRWMLLSKVTHNSNAS